VKRLNPETGKEFECGDTREYDPKGKGRLIFRGYQKKINKDGNSYEIWETPEKFWGRAQERKEYIVKYTLDPVNRAKYIYSRTRDGAKRRKIGFHIIVEDVIPALKQGLCQMTGLPFVLDKPEKGSSTHPYAPSIDRIDSNKDYTKDNIRIVLWAVNAATNQFTDKEMLPILKAMVAAMEQNANKIEPTSVSDRTHQQGEVYPELGPFSSSWPGEDDNNAHYHSGTISWQDFDHRAQESSGDSVAHRNKKVEPSITLTRIENNGDAEPEIIRLEFGRRYLSDKS
jgi:hypothetical protein